MASHPVPALRSRPRPHLALLLSAAALAGCGGGGGSASFVTVSPDQVSFQAARDGMLPSAQRLEVKFRGDVLLVGYPPDVAEPGWLQVSGSRVTDTLAYVDVQPITTALLAGRYETTLRFVTGKEDGSDVSIKDVAVSLQVRNGLVAGPASLTFSTVEGVSPAPQAITLTSDLANEGWTITSEAGGPAIAWLVLSSPAGQLVQGVGEVQVTPLALEAGDYQAALQVRDGDGSVRATIPVGYHVDGAMAFSAPVVFDVTHASTFADLERTVTLRTRLDAGAGAGYRWTAASDLPWLTVTPASGDLAADTTLTARLDPDQIWSDPAVTRQGRITVSLTTAQAGAINTMVTLNWLNGAALQVAPQVTIPVDAATTAPDLRRNVLVGSNLGEVFASRAMAGWTPSTASDWLSVTSAGADLAIEVRQSALAGIGNAIQRGIVTITPTDPRVAGAQVQVEMPLSLPEVQHVAPYTAWVGQAGEVVLRGVAFGAGPTLPLAFGAQQLEGRVLSDTEVRLTAPAQVAPGPVEVTAVNGLGLPRGGAVVEVLPAPGYAAADLVLPLPFTRLALDPERQAVLLTGPGTNQVYRLAFDGTGWSASSLAVIDATNVAVTLDGTRLLVSSGYPVASLGATNTFLELDPTTLAIERQASLGAFYSQFDIVAPLNDGRTLLADSDQWADTYWYPSFAKGPYLDSHGSKALLTRDRSRLVVAGAYGTSSLDASESAFRSRSLVRPPGPQSSWSVSGDGGRLMVWDALYDRGFADLGEVTLQEPGAWAVALSPDGAWAYTAGRTAVGAPWVFRRASVAGAAPYAAEATPLAFTIPASEAIVAMVVSDDGGTLFVLTDPAAGSNHLLHVRPLP